MGAVYEAIHKSIERRVALKVLHPEYARRPEAVTRFFNEARAVNLIEHPNIVQVSEFGIAGDGTAYLVMEFLRGETLSRRIETLAAVKQRVPPIAVVQIGMQLADALAAAHEKGIVHRDLKPGNIMLVADSLSASGERVKLLDFGIAKLMLSQRGAHGKVTTTNAIMGTPQYMSPEQCRGASCVDDRTDVYALGVIMYELIAGHPPFWADEPLGYLGQHVYQTPPLLASLAPQAPPELLTLIHKLLIKDKFARPAMRVVCTELTCILSSLAATVADAKKPAGQGSEDWFGSSGGHSTFGRSLVETVRARPVLSKTLLAVASLGILGVIGITERLLTSLSPSSLAAVQPSRIALPPTESPKPTDLPAPTESQILAEPLKPVESPKQAMPALLSPSTPIWKLSTGNKTKQPTVDQSRRTRPKSVTLIRRPTDSAHATSNSTMSATPPKHPAKFVD